MLLLRRGNVRFDYPIAPGTRNHTANVAWTDSLREWKKGVPRNPKPDGQRGVDRFLRRSPLDNAGTACPDFREKPGIVPGTRNPKPFY
jgi:hypothetical protein